MTFRINHIFFLIITLINSSVCANRIETDTSKNILFHALKYASIGYVNEGLYKLGGQYHNLSKHSQINKFLLGADYLTDHTIAYKLGYGRRFDIRQSSAIDAMISFRDQPYFRSDKFDYTLHYKKLRLDLDYYFNSDKADNIYLSVTHISEQQASFVNNLPIKLNMPITDLKIGYYSQKDLDVYSYNQNLFLENAFYKSQSMDKNSFLKLNHQSNLHIPIDKKRLLKFGGYLAYMLQNNHRTTMSYANELVKGSISLSGLSMGDYLYDHVFFSRKGAVNLFDNQAMNLGGRMRYFGTRSSSLGLSNDFGFAILSSIEVVKNKIFHIAPFLDYGGVKSLSGMSYIYTAGLEINIKDRLSITLPFFQSKELQNANDFVSQRFLNRIGFNFDFRKMYFNKNHFNFLH